MSLLRALKYAIYLARRKKPLTTGYGVYKKHRIAEILAASAFDPEHLRPGYGEGLDERLIEYPWLFARLPAGSGRLLDAGSVLNFDYILEQPALRSKQVFICTLAPEGRQQRTRQNVSYVYEDLRTICFRDNYFDWIVCLSTLEHVGLDNTRFYVSDVSKREGHPDAYLEAVAELRRVLRPGGILYASVPFGQYRNHGWFQVFDAERVDTVLAAFKPASYRESHYRYERDGWRISSREASHGATYSEPDPSSTRDRDDPVAAGAVACLELVK
jgi:SAM-dependent methyltransferase